MDYLHILTTSFANIDLSSAEATRAPTFTFPPANRQNSLISLFHCSKPQLTCLHIKDWLIQSFNNPHLAAPGIVRIERQKLESIADRENAWMLMAEDAAVMHTDFLGKEKSGLPVTILAIILPHDEKIRWFYTILSPSPVLQRLDNHNLIQLARFFNPGSNHHTRLTTFISSAFTAATAIPHHPDFLAAESITDYSPPILNPATALQRLEQNEHLYFAIRNSEASTRDLSNDRYLLCLHEAEREVASLANLRCAEYLLLKRGVFRVFWEEVYRSEKKIDPEASAVSTMMGGESGGDGDAVEKRDCEDERADSVTPSTRQNTPAPAPAQSSQPSTPHRRGLPRNTSTHTPSRRSVPPSTSRTTTSARNQRNRIRTEHAHKIYLENEYGFGSSRARMLVVAWRELGFLDEGWFVHWVGCGGMLEDWRLGGGVREEG